MVDVLPYTPPGNNKPVGNGWVKKVEKCNNVSTTMSVKLDFYELNIPLKYVTKVEILNRIYSDPQKKRKYCDNTIHKDTKKNNYTDNDVHANIGPKLQKMSKSRY